MATDILDRPEAVTAADGYAGDIGSRAALDVLRANQRAVLIDVRTAPEWEYVGRPDLSGLGRETVLIPWKTWRGRKPEGGPDLAQNERFVEEVAAAGIAKDQPVLLLCRSGQRSRDAAIALTRAGYARCFNIADGFEGPKDAAGHRNTVEGWRASGLPWTQG